MNQRPDTYLERLRKYQRRERMTVWVGAAYAGLVVLMTTKAFDQASAPSFLNALLVTFIIVGAFCLGKARVGFEWLATSIDRNIQDRTVNKEDPVPPTEKWPVGLDKTWFVSLYLLTASGIVTIVAVWWKTVSRLF